MGAQARTIKLSPDLDEAADILAQQHGYGSRNALVKGLLRYACLCEGKHDTTLPWSKLSTAEQDKVDANCLAVLKSGQFKHGQLLRHIVDDMQSGLSSEESLARLAESKERKRKKNGE